VVAVSLKKKLPLGLVSLASFVPMILL